MERIYLDYNATAPMERPVRESVEESLREAFGNPSSLHWAGQRARHALEQARRRAARLVGAEAREVVFTSGATESNNLALKAIFGMGPDAGGHVVAASIEHQAVLRPCRFLQSCGVEATYVAPDSQGRVEAQAVADAIRPETRAVSVMLANNDTGVIQPLREIARLAKEKGVPVHTDATQAVGRIAVDVKALGVDLLSFSSHKLGGPKGSGALVLREGFKLTPLLHGGGQESGRRAGTENIPGAAGFGAACALSRERLAVYGERVGRLRDRLEEGARAICPEAVIYGKDAPRLPNTTLLSFPGVDGLGLAMNLDAAGIAVSNGSACAAGSQAPSHVLQAMGADCEGARGAVRISTGFETTEAEIDALLAELAGLLAALRSRRRR